MESQSNPRTTNCFIAIGDRRSRSPTDIKQTQRKIFTRYDNYKNNRLLNRDESVMMKSFGDKTAKEFNINQDIHTNKHREDGIHDYNARQAFNRHQELRNESVTHLQPNLVSQCVDVHYVSCSRKIQDSANHEPDDAGRDNVYYDNCSESINTGKEYVEKTTYRPPPVMHFYNQEFLKKTVERNTRLQSLAKDMVQARHIEKEKEAWNNYINDLKNKHRYFSNEPRQITTQYVPENKNDAEINDDFYNTRFFPGQSNLYDCNEMPSTSYRVYSTEPKTRLPRYKINYEPYIYGYENKPYSYPISSQGRLIVLNRERKREINEKRENSVYDNEDKNKMEYKRQKMISSQSSESAKSLRSQRNYIKESKNIDTQQELQTSHLSKENKSIKLSEPRLQLFKTRGICRCCFDTENRSQQQTDLDKIKLSRYDNQQHNKFTKEERIRKEYKNVSDNIDRPKQKDKTTQHEKKQCSLANIEIKLDTLIKSINVMMTEIQSKNASQKHCLCVPTVTHQFSSEDNRRLNYTKSDTFGLVKKEKIVCGMLQGNSSRLGVSKMSNKSVVTDKSKIDKILNEELNKSNKVKRDIDKILNSQMDSPCNVQITFDIPTRDRSTEVTVSLSKAKIDSNVIVEEIDPPGAVKNDRHMTIAVNTDPLGLLALLKISSETVKQILSYMPHIDYLSYFPMLQFPQLPSSRVSHYVCYICGATFSRPSQLSDHIEQHNLGYSRDCCICRHVVDITEQNSGLFPCRYCGQCFTRAYCCELHQKTCATRLGKIHDVSSSLMLLK